MSVRNYENLLHANGFFFKTETENQIMINFRTIFRVSKIPKFSSPGGGGGGGGEGGYSISASALSI